MTLFWILISVLIAIALAFVVTPLLRTRAISSSTRAGMTNIDLYREQLAELDVDKATGVLQHAQYIEARDELGQRLLTESSDATEIEPPKRQSSNIVLIISLVILMPLCALLIYLKIGHLPNTTDLEQQEIGLTQIESMVNKLATRLKQEPNDAQGWVMLGKSYMVLEQYPQATQAYAKAYALLKQDTAVAADYAEASILANEGNVAAEALVIINGALKLDAKHLKLNSLAGMAAFQSKDYRGAIDHWTRVEDQLSADSEDRKILLMLLERARAQLISQKTMASPKGK